MRDLPINGDQLRHDGWLAAHRAADDLRAARLNGTLDATRVMTAKLEAEVRWARKSSGIRQFRPAAMLALVRHWTNRYARVIRRSGLFDRGWYLYCNPDVEASGQDPLLHYVHYGWREGRDPSPFFSVSWYLNHYVDVRRAGFEPLCHYINFGTAEGRDPHPLFKSSWYLMQNSDVTRDGANPLLHYITCGAAEGRDPHPWFRTDWYLAQNPEVARSGLNPLFHYVTRGAAEGRDTHPWFKGDWYLVHNPGKPRRGAAAVSRARDALPPALGQLVHMFHDDSATRVINTCNEILTRPSARDIAPGQVGSDPLVASLIEKITSLAGRDSGSGEIDATVMISPAGTLIDTLCCLYSVLALQTPFRFEIIVATEAAATRALIERIGGVVRNAREGAGPGVVRGRVLVLLDPCAIVLPNWLDELIGTLDADASIGLVGSKSVNPDGSMRGNVHSDFGGANDACAPQVNYLKDVTTVPGVSIAISTSLWEALGVVAANGDLAARVRAAGLRTVYQPFSAVVDRGSSVEGDESVAQADVRPRILFMDHAVPRPDQDAGSRVMMQYLAMFARAGFRVVLWPQDLFFNKPYVMALQRLGIEVAYGWNGIWPAFDVWLEANGMRLDYVLLHRPVVAGNFIDQICSRTGAKTLFLGADIHFRRMEMERKATGDSIGTNDLQNMEKLERDIWKKSAVVYYHSDSEVSFVKSAYPDLNVQLFPIFIFDRERLNETSQRIQREGISRGPELLFVGGFRHSPNVDAMIWFVGEIWPLVAAAVPDARLIIAGSSPPQPIQALGSDAITVSGAISDEELARRYAEATVAIVPLRFGAGVKGKLLEALSYGRPVVTTSVGIQGLSALGPLVDVADDARTFAEAVIDILRDPGSRMDKVVGGLKYLEENLTEAGALAALAKEIPELRVHLDSLPRPHLHSAA
jgi:glycosyltransferase involved in cell wall biosynthesis